MSEVAIRFDHVSKGYRLRARRYLRSLGGEAITRLRQTLLGDRVSPDYFWALRDITFEIRRGETVGLIGPNGAGKSTVLKILSRVTVPTSGSFHLNGRVGALIEVGAGFHGDLTGRENVYLNGAIMGMSQAEIDAKFDRIVAFAEVENFIDTPIKNYSSGMEVRLGFAVAAHIEPDILLVDEVLAVGDAAFQAKCLNKLADLKEQAKTIVLVSHNMANILQQSDRVLWIDRGRVRAFGDPETVAEQYLRTTHVQHDAPSVPDVGADHRPIRILDVKVLGGRGHDSDVLAHGREALIEIHYQLRPDDHPVLAVTFEDAHGHPLGGLTTALDGVKLDASRPRGSARLCLSPVLFTRGAYTVSVAAYDERLQRCLDLRPRAVSFTVEGPSVASREVTGHVVYPHRWELPEGR